MSDLHIHIDGLDKVLEAFRRFPTTAPRYFEGAGTEAGEEIVNTDGLRRYPGTGPGNEPPTPYYIRGRGTQYANGNDGRSERYGTQFYVEPKSYRTTIGNRASYAKYLTDADDQAKRMEAIGWRKLSEVAEDKRPVIEGIYQRWTDKMLEDLGLI